MPEVIDRFDGWLVIDTDMLQKAIKNLPPHLRKFKTIKNATGLSPHQLTDYVQGKRYPNLKNFKRLCLYMQVSADELLGLKITPNND